MNRVLGWRRCLGWGLLLLAGAVQAGGNPASLRRGAALFMQDCAACHSLNYLRPRQLQQDFGFTDAEGRPPEAPLTSPLPAAVAQLALGKPPPDLSLEVRRRGAAWVAAYLQSFYLDVDGHWNNRVLPGAAMPDPFWQTQGIKRLDKGGHWQTLRRGELSPAAFREQVEDLSAFLRYAADPSILPRRALGPWVLGFLSIFCLLAWLSMRACWKRLPGASRD